MMGQIFVHVQRGGRHHVGQALHPYFTGDRAQQLPKHRNQHVGVVQPHQGQRYQMMGKAMGDVAAVRGGGKQR